MFQVSESTHHETQRHIREDLNPERDFCENPRSYKVCEFVHIFVLFRQGKQDLRYDHSCSCSLQSMQIPLSVEHDSDCCTLNCQKVVSDSCLCCSVGIAFMQYAGYGMWGINSINIIVFIETVLRCK